MRSFRESAGNRAGRRIEAPSIERDGNGATVHLYDDASGLLDHRHLSANCSISTGGLFGRPSVLSLVTVTAEALPPSRVNLQHQRLYDFGALGRFGPGDVDSDALRRHHRALDSLAIGPKSRPCSSSLSSVWKSAVS